MGDGHLVCADESASLWLSRKGRAWKRIVVSEKKRGRLDGVGRRMDVAVALSLIMNMLLHSGLYPCNSISSKQIRRQNMKDYCSQSRVVLDSPFALFALFIHTCIICGESAVLG